MIQGNYARVTKLPVTEQASKLLVYSLDMSFHKLREEGKLSSVLNEEFIKTTAIKNKISVGNEEYTPVSIGSTWLLKCEVDHQFHYHTFEDDDFLSYRKVLFFSDAGFTLEFYSIDHSTGKMSNQLEKFVVEKASVVELEFDGRIVHRFRPVKEGKLFAYSIHIKDLSAGNDAAKTQTHEVLNVPPQEEQLILV
ncbi:hypothetical protein [Erwinia amylovora]|uniref:Uncharacterized protein n=2 Tax=Erwinia amylovora TaxID=552 RepID=A0A831EUT5_ERWAM|nr:hypothetical protein [Erwinia amylovora]CDK16532.1 hypothetical protein LA635_2908 [Erwinia amylovora LA635]CDK19899.1 hypothetical protein LA636_2907 [Erwinia amylovora LA636]CDK23270.1 hypothetical protein LA637_2910 [Erwinia amylovora LA637]ATZ10359.1 hypothetical protein AD997_02170 [Erwinia amylovora]EKV52639.1 hypothetical protein EaACW_3228 [Erwinia amylovora ACW56400]